MNQQTPPPLPGEYEGGEDILNAQLLAYLRGRRCALAVETKGDRWAAIIRVTVRPFIRDGQSPNDFAVISGPLFNNWEERLGDTPHDETLAAFPSLPEAQAYLAEWQSA